MNYSHERIIPHTGAGQGLWRPDQNAGLLKPKDPPSTVEQWKNAPATWETYSAGRVSSPDGTSYRYDSGIRLNISPIDGEPYQVMDTCEAPWAVATVNAAFAAEPIARLNPQHKMKVFERGAGLNIAGTKVINHLMQRGSGEYHVAELNDDVLNHPEHGTYAWRTRMLDFINESSRKSGIRYDIDIVIHEGDATAVTEDLARAGKKFNIVISDTFPITPEEEGINDIKDIETTTQIMFKKEGVFTFFAYHPGMQESGTGSHMTATQLAILRPMFGNIQASEAAVKPAKDYKYLFNGDVPVKNLPVVVCCDKK